MKAFWDLIFSDWTRSDAIAAIAVLITTTPYIWRSIRKGAVAFHHTGSIEVGYSGYGPTIGLTGTLQATGRDQFVTKMKVSVTRTADHATEGFDWLIVRPYVFSLSDPVAPDGTALYEIPSSFLIPLKQPHKFNILFAGTRIQEGIQRQLRGLRATWQAYLSNLDPKLISAEQGKKVIETFRQSSNAYSDAYTAVDRLFQWSPGSYSLKLYLSTDRGLDTTYKTAFSLTDDESKQLRLNTYITTETALGNEDQVYNFIYAQYQEPMR